MADFTEINFGPLELAKGDIVTVGDDVDPKIHDNGVVKFIEPDNENETLYWVYIAADEEVINSNYDSRIGAYCWCLEHCSPRITLLSHATTT